MSILGAWGCFVTALVLRVGFGASSARAPSLEALIFGAIGVSLLALAWVCLRWARVRHAGWLVAGGLILVGCLGWFYLGV